MPVREECDREAEASRATVGEVMRIWGAVVVEVVSMVAFGGLPS